MHKQDHTRAKAGPHACTSWTTRVHRLAPACSGWPRHLHGQHATLKSTPSSQPLHTRARSFTGLTSSPLLAGYLEMETDLSIRKADMWASLILGAPPSLLTHQKLHE